MLPGALFVCVIFRRICQKNPTQNQVIRGRKSRKMERDDFFSRKIRMVESSWVFNRNRDIVALRRQQNHLRKTKHLFSDRKSVV